MKSVRESAFYVIKCFLIKGVGDIIIGVRTQFLVCPLLAETRLANLSLGKYFCYS